MAESMTSHQNGICLIVACDSHLSRLEGLEHLCDGVLVRHLGLSDRLHKRHDIRQGLESRMVDY
jgi:hypothetical protein